MVYSAFYDKDGKEYFIPKKSVKENQAGEVLTRLLKSNETKIQNNQPPRPEKKHRNIKEKQYSEQSHKMANNKKFYKKEIENFLKELEEYEKGKKKNLDPKKVDDLILYRNYKILFRK